jgi:hypothetical protein
LVGPRTAVTVLARIEGGRTGSVAAADGREVSRVGNRTSLSGSGPERGRNGRPLAQGGGECAIFRNGEPEGGGAEVSGFGFFRQPERVSNEPRPNRRSPKIRLPFTPEMVWPAPGTPRNVVRRGRLAGDRGSGAARFACRNEAASGDRSVCNARMWWARCVKKWKGTRTKGRRIADRVGFLVRSGKMWERGPYRRRDLDGATGRWRRGVGTASRLRTRNGTVGGHGRIATW